MKQKTLSLSIFLIVCTVANFSLFSQSTLAQSTLAQNTLEPPGASLYRITNYLPDKLHELFASEGWDMELIDTARHVEYLSVVEKDVILATNALRVHPQRYSDLYLRNYLEHYRGRVHQLPWEKIQIRSREGADAVREAIRVLSRQRALPVMIPSEGMSRAAAGHAEEQAESGRTGHTGRFGSTPLTRLEPHGVWGLTLGENISYGTDNGIAIVNQLFIDDGVPSRGHRDTLLNEDFLVTGVSVNTHPRFRTACVIMYAGTFNEN